nr:hypothetical protein [Tanacetum cinerariifolium]
MDVHDNDASENFQPSYGKSGGTGGRAGRGSARTRGRSGNQGDGRNDGLGGQGSKVNGSIGKVPDFSTIIAQQLQNLLPTIVAPVGNDSRGCTYKEFLACNSKEYDGKGGVIEYTHWIKKMESVHDMSGCRDSQRVKYTASSFVDFRTLTREEFCLSNEMQMLETELWNHAMVGAGHIAYTDRFHDLSRLVPHLVTPESKRIKRYVYGLGLQIQGIVEATKPKTIQKAVQLAGTLTGEAFRNGSIKMNPEKRGNRGEPSKDMNGKDDNKRNRTRNAFAMTTNPLRGGYTGMAPKCTTCSYHYPTEIACHSCFNWNHLGHFAKDCRVIPRNVNPINARNPVARTCFECGSTDHIRNYNPKGEKFLIASRFPTPPLACAFFNPGATVNDLRDGFCSLCNSRNSCVYDPNLNSFNCPPNSYHPPHPTYETYSGDSCGNDSNFGYDCPPRFPLNYESEPGYIENYNSYPYDSSSFPQQYLCCTRCGGPRETCQCDQLIFDEPHCFDQTQPPQSPVIHQPPQEMSIQEMEDLKQQYFDEIKRLINSEYRDEIKIDELKGNFNSMSIEINKKEKLLQLEQLANFSTYPSKRLNSFCYDDDDDEDYTIAVTPSLSTEEPDNSLSMGDEHLDTIPETDSDEEIESSVKNLNLTPSESDDLFDYVSECDLPFCDNSLDFNNDYEIFSYPLFDSKDNYTSSDDESSSEEDILVEHFKIYSNPLLEFNEEIFSCEINPLYNEVLEDLDPIPPRNDHFNVESDLIESLLNKVTMIISPKIDFILEEFAGEPALINPIPLGIAETKFDPKVNIRLIKKLLYDNSSPRPPEELNSENDFEKENSGNTTIYTDISLLEYESFYDKSDSASEIFNDDLAHTISPSKYRYVYADDESNSGDLTTKVVDDISDNSTRELYVHVPNVLITLPTIYPVFDTLLPLSSENKDKVFNPGILISKEEKSPPLLSHRGLKVFQLINDFESPMMIYGGDMPILDVNIRLIKKLLYDNSSPRPPEELNSKNDFEKENSGSTTIHTDISLPEYESFYDKSDSASEIFNDDLAHIISPSKYGYVYADDEFDSGDLTTKVVDDISDNSTRELYVHVPNVLITLPTIYLVFDTLLPLSFENKDKVFNPGILISKEEKSPPLLSYRGLKVFQLINDSESPMMIYGWDMPILDVPTSPTHIPQAYTKAVSLDPHPGNLNESLRKNSFTFHKRAHPDPQPQTLETSFKARARDYMEAHMKRMEKFENAIFKQREKINDRMAKIMDKEKSVENNGVVCKNIIEPNKSNVAETLEEVDRDDEVENRDEPFKSAVKDFTGEKVRWSVKLTICFP